MSAGKIEMRWFCLCQLTLQIKNPPHSFGLVTEDMLIAFADLYLTFLDFFTQGTLLSLGALNQSFFVRQSSPGLGSTSRDEKEAAITERFNAVKGHLDVLSERYDGVDMLLARVL